MLLAQQGSSADARLAVEMFCDQAAKSVGALTVALGGLDTLVFTGGVGEHAAPVRQTICERLGHLGVTLDVGANAHPAEVISAAGSRVAVHVLETDEDLVIARYSRDLL